MRQWQDHPQVDVFPSCTGGRTILYGDYVYEFLPDHPDCNMWGYLAQHRFVAERSLGRVLLPGESVHHRDGNPTNNADQNLLVLTETEHRRLHNRLRAEARWAGITEAMVREALQGRTLKEAATILRCHQQTLRSRFPDILAPRTRKSPTRIDDPRIVETIRTAAPDPALGYREIARRWGIAEMTVKRICERHSIPWVKKSRLGEKRRQYRRTTASPAG